MNHKTKNSKSKYPKVQSVIAQYIRGEKNLQDIVHPSKLTRIRCEQQQCTKSLAPLARIEQPKTSGKRKTNDSCPADPIVTLEINDDDDRAHCHRDGGDSLASSAKPIRIERVNRIDSQAEQAIATAVKTPSTRCVGGQPDSAVEPTKSENLRSRRLAANVDVDKLPLVTNMFDWDTRIRHEAIVTSNCCRGGGGSSFVANVSDCHNSSATSTSTSTSKTSEKLTSSDESASSKLPDGSDSRSTAAISHYEKNLAKTFTTASGSSGSSSSSIVSSTGGGVNTSLVDDNDDSKQLRADIRYFEEKIAQERAQIDELNDEIGKAQRIHDEYNAANQENAAANSAAKIVSKREFENVLAEFLNASESWSSSTNVSNVGLDFVITDYFTKCYDNLSKKVHQCDSQRKVLSILVDSLKKNRIALQNRINELRNKTIRESVS